LSPGERRLVHGLGKALLAGLICLGGGCPAPSVASLPRDASRGTPTLAFAKTTHDFGDVVGTLLSTEFSFRNEGTSDLHIGGIEASCGCTSATYSAKVIPPKGEGTVKVSFDAQAFNGAIHKTVTVASDDPEHPRVTLEFTATVRSMLEFEPKAVHLRFSNKAKRKQKVFFLGDDALEVKPGSPTLTGLSALDPGVKASFFRGGKPVRVGVEVRLTRQPANAGQGKVEFETGLPLPSHLIIPVSWEP
jgi:hypothetical protein